MEDYVHFLMFTGVYWFDSFQEFPGGVAPIPRDRIVLISTVQGSSSTN